MPECLWRDGKLVNRNFRACRAGERDPPSSSRQRRAGRARQREPNGLVVRSAGRERRLRERATEESKLDQQRARLGPARIRSLDRVASDAVIRLSASEASGTGLVSA